MADKIFYLDYNGLKTYDSKVKEWTNDKISDAKEELNTRIDSLPQGIDESTVIALINESIQNLTAEAPESFDTFKEISDWISTHSNAASGLIQAVAELDSRVSANEDAISKIEAIASDDISYLFLTAVPLQENQTVSDAITSLSEDQKLVLDVNITPTIEEDLTINNNCVIEAENVEFTGTITVADNVQAVILGATFSGPVVVA